MNINCIIETGANVLTLLIFGGLFLLGIAYGTKGTVSVAKQFIKGKKTNIDFSILKEVGIAVAVISAVGVVFTLLSLGVGFVVVYLGFGQC